MANFIDYAVLFTTFATIFVVTDPIGLATISVVPTLGIATKKRGSIALRACVLPIMGLSLFGLLGKSALGFFATSMPALQFSRGALLF